MSGVRIQRFRRPDRVRLADHVAAIQTYGGKPRVSRDTAPVVSTIAGHFFDDADEMTRVDIPTYDQIPRSDDQIPRSGNLPDDRTLVVRVPPRWEAALAVAFLAGFALAAVVVYLAMR